MTSNRIDATVLGTGKYEYLIRLFIHSTTKVYLFCFEHCEFLYININRIQPYQEMQTHWVNNQAQHELAVYHNVQVGTIDKLTRPFKPFFHHCLEA